MTIRYLTLFLHSMVGYRYTATIEAVLAYKELSVETAMDQKLFDELPLTKITDDLYRLRCNNPGVMPGSGTNTYLVDGEAGFAIIDPGPCDPDHINNILLAVGSPGNITMILVTHMHPDHSPAASPLALLSKAPVYGLPPVEDPFQDATCNPDHIVSHDQVLSLGDVSIRCLHTPGHVDNHVCYMLEQGGIVMTGDHIMQGSTVVIIPPHGKMKAYIESLQLLLEYPVQQLAPGHGEMITKPEDEIMALVKHRHGREQKVIDKFSVAAPITLKALTPLVYDDVDASLHPVAELSLHAHLLKLAEEERASCIDDQWFWQAG